MKTRELFLDDQYMKECDSKVTMVEFTDMIVDQSVFFPTRLGEPNDKGFVTINGNDYIIVDVWEDGENIHLISLDTYPQDITGQTVHQRIDWNTRYNHMRYRSALFLISGIAYKFYNARCRMNQTYEDSAWIDVYVDEMDEEKLEKIKTEMKKIIDSSIDINVLYMTREEFTKNSQLMNLSKDRMPEGDNIRIINIPGLPMQPDRGVHVKNTSEIGDFEITTTMAKGKMEKRLTVKLK